MTKQNTTFILSGGAGRIVTAIPALEKYHKLNPKDNFKVLIGAWDILYWGHPILQNRTFEANQKGIFDHHIKDNRVVVPEPYYSHRFFNQEINLIEAFDEIINITKDHSDLEKPKLYLSDFEIANAKGFIDKIKHETGKTKVIVFQPFGSGAKFINGEPIDSSNRSLYAKAYLSLIEQITDTAIILFASAPEFKHPQDNVSFQFDELGPYLRSLMAFTYHCDYFVGIDSVAQHVAYAFNKPGVTLFGGTHEKNFGYPNDHLCVRIEGRKPVYSPWRLTTLDCELTDRLNSGIMNFSDEDINQISQHVNNSLESIKPTQKPAEFIIPMNDYSNINTNNHLEDMKWQIHLPDKA